MKRSNYVRLICQQQGLHGPFFPRPSKPEKRGTNWGDQESWTAIEGAYIAALQAGGSWFEAVPSIDDEETLRAALVVDDDDDDDDDDENWDEATPDAPHVTERLADFIATLQRSTLSIPQKWVLKRLGKRYADIANDIVHDAYILWIELGGTTSPYLCLKRTLLNTLQRERIAQKIFTPLTIHTPLRLGRRECGLRVEDLPNYLQPVATLSRDGYTIKEIASKLRCHRSTVSRLLNRVASELHVKLHKRSLPRPEDSPVY